MKHFDEQYLAGLSEDPKLAMHSICRKYLAAATNKGPSFDMSLEIYALIETLSSANEMDIQIPPLPVGQKDQIDTIKKFAGETYASLMQYVQSDKEQRQLENLRKEFSIHITKAFTYEFSEGDLNRIQELLNELRKLVAESKLFEAKHQRRLLNRLERLQQELHKKQSDLDHFWGLVGDAGVAIGKFGKDAKPFVDRIKEITNIVWRTQSRAEELSSDSKPAFLTYDDDEQ